MSDEDIPAAQIINAFAIRFSPLI
jgi:hypothetical protein